MQAQVFGNILEEAHEKLRVKELIQQIQPFVTRGMNYATSGTKKTLPKLIFEAREGFVLMRQDSAKAELLDRLGFTRMFDPNAMTEVLSILNAVDSTQNVWNNSSNLPPYINFYSSLIALNEFKTAFDKLVLEPKKAGVAESEDVLSFEVLDYDGGGIEPPRLASLMRAITRLHDTVTRVVDVPSTLRVVALDSGSNSLVTVKADGKVVKEIRTLLGQVWHVVRFWKLNDFDRRLQSLDKGLDMLESIDARVKNGTLDHATGELLKHKLKVEAVAIVSHGSLPKEIVVDATVQTRQLLIEKRDPKLLTMGDESSTSPAEEPESPVPESKP
jgi:hypothetical protein